MWERILLFAVKIETIRNIALKIKEYRKEILNKHPNDMPRQKDAVKYTNGLFIGVQSVVISSFIFSKSLSPTPFTFFISSIDEKRPWFVL